MRIHKFACMIDEIKILWRDLKMQAMVFRLAIDPIFRQNLISNGQSEDDMMRR